MLMMKLFKIKTPGAACGWNPKEVEERKNKRCLWRQSVEKDMEAQGIALYNIFW